MKWIIILALLPVFLTSSTGGIAASKVKTSTDELADYRKRNSKVIRIVFGPKYGAQAIRVAKCESGLSTRASNGQYLGLFQMGSWARSVYGHGKTAWSQSFSAEAYFIASGRDWSPWACKPW